MDRAESWMQIASTFAALVDTDGRAIPARVSRHEVDHVIAGCDLGNSAIKLVLRQANAPQLRLFRFESIYTPAAMIRAGDDTTALRVFRNGAWSEWFWIDQGDTVGGEALPIGSLDGGRRRDRARGRAGAARPPASRAGGPNRHTAGTQLVRFQQ
jgi:hypothetical protein